MAGLVTVDGRLVDKPGTPTRGDADLAVKPTPRYVSRGGEKLAHALDHWRLDITGRRALDVGASTGGFVDCLLQRGVECVIALDVGYGQLDARLRHDPRVSVLERVNARYLTGDLLPYAPDLLTMDVSFISVEKVLPAVSRCLAEVFEGLILVKPQFEAGRASAGKKGVVRDPAVHKDVLLRLGHAVIRSGIEIVDACDSGLLGADGNREFFFHVSRGGGAGLPLDTLGRHVEDVVGGVAER